MNKIIKFLLGLFKEQLLECINCKNVIKFERVSLDSQYSCPYCDGVLRRKNV